MAKTEAPQPDGGWQQLPGVGEPVERAEFDTFDFLDELSHPMRARVMRQLIEPNTIAAIAAALDVPVTRLYHHMNRLEAAGLIRVVATRKVGAVTERRYQVCARSIGVAPKFFASHDPVEVATALGSIFDMAKLGLQRQVESGGLDFENDDDSTVLSFGHVELTPARRRELIGRLTDLIEEFTSDASDDQPDATKVALFIAAHLDAP